MKLAAINKEKTERVFLNSETVKEARNECPENYDVYEEIATNHYIKAKS